MHNSTKKTLLIASILVLASTLSACSDTVEQSEMLQQALAIESTDECHLCGMIITHFPGPKGELFRKGVNSQQSNKVHKFCSTRDLFSFYLDPENKRNVTTIYVHDMSKVPWETPNDDHFVDATKAWYVTGSDRMGAMGKTLASFSLKGDAEAFTEQFGGSVIAFSEITMDVLM